MFDRFIKYYDFKDYEKVIEDSKMGSVIKVVFKWWGEEEKGGMNEIWYDIYIRIF